MPTVADVEILAKTLGSILAGKPQSHGALTVIPILTPMQTEPEWLTLAEAGDRVRITEISEGGSVPDLKVANLGDLPLLLLDGEQLVGAKQNRILNMTMLVAAQTEVTIPVSCVEQGRWGYRARHSAPSDFSLYAGLRAKKSAWVSRSLREGRGHAADQQGVWEALALKAEAHDVQSPTGAMHDFYARFEPEIAKAREALAPAPGQVGAVAYVAGRWAGLDLLAGPRRFSRAWPRLCAGYAADALRRAPAARHVPGASRLLKMLAACPVEPAPAVGAEYRLSGEKLTGATLVAEERVAHLMVLPVDAPVDRGNVRRFESKGLQLRAVDKLGVDLVCERIATPLIHVMEDALDRGTLPLDTSRRAELEHSDCAAPGVEDKEIVWIAAMRDGRFEGSHGALKAHALVVVGDWIERKRRGEKPARDPQDRDNHCEPADQPSNPLQHSLQRGKRSAKSHPPQIRYLGGGIRRGCQPADEG